MEGLQIAQKPLNIIVTMLFYFATDIALISDKQTDCKALGTKPQNENIVKKVLQVHVCKFAKWITLVPGHIPASSRYDNVTGVLCHMNSW